MKYCSFRGVFLNELGLQSWGHPYANYNPSQDADKEKYKKHYNQLKLKILTALKKVL